MMSTSLNIESISQNGYRAFIEPGKPLSNPAEEKILEPIVSWADRLEQAAYVISTVGKLMHANRQGNMSITIGELRLSSELRLYPSTHADRFKWESAISAALRAGQSMILARYQECLKAYSFRTFEVRRDAEVTTGLVVLASRSRPFDGRVVEHYANFHGLTPSETDAMALVCAGLSIPDIADRSKLKESTVRSHIRAVLSKTSCNSIRAIQAEIGRLSSI